MNQYEKQITINVSRRQPLFPSNYRRAVLSHLEHKPLPGFFCPPIVAMTQDLLQWTSNNFYGMRPALDYSSNYGGIGVKLAQSLKQIVRS